LAETVSIGVRLPRDVLDYVEEEARREKLDRSNMIRRLMERGIEEFRKERAAKIYIEGKASISGAADIAGLTIPEMVDYLVSRGYRSGYSLVDFRRGVTILEERLKQE
jgi:hypothetical protein